RLGTGECEGSKGREQPLARRPRPRGEGSGSSDPSCNPARWEAPGWEIRVLRDMQITAANDQCDITGPFHYRNRALGRGLRHPLRPLMGSQGLVRPPARPFGTSEAAGFMQPALDVSPGPAFTCQPADFIKAQYPCG